MKLKKVIAAVTAAAVAIGSFTAYSIVSPKFSLSAEMSPENGKIIVDTEEDSELAFAFYDRAENASGEPIAQIEDETNKYAVDADTEILAVVTLPDTLEDGKKLSVFYGEESESFFENDKTTFSFSFTMPEEGIVVGAEIKDLDIYNITAAVEDSETGSVTINGQDASEGVQATENSEVIVEAEPAEGYEVGTIMVITDRETFGIDSGDSFVMPSGDVEVQVTFAEKSKGKYAISISCDGSGTATITVNGVEVDSANEGDTVTVTCNPNEGYELEKIEAYGLGLEVFSITITSDPSNENVYTFIMPADEVRVHTTFHASEYKINTIITAPDMGSAYVTSRATDITFYTNSNTFVNETAYTNDKVYIIAVPAQGYRLDTITVVDSNDMPISFTQDNNKATFSMPACDVTVTVSFTERNYDAQTYTISADDTENGSITVNPEAEEGEKISIRCVPDAGYKLAEITITSENGETYSGENYIQKESSSHNYCSYAFNNGSHLYSFTMPDSNVTVTVSFKKTYEIKLNIYPSPWNGCIYWGRQWSDEGTLFDPACSKPNKLDNICMASKDDIIKFEPLPFGGGDGDVDCSVIDSDGNMVDISVEFYYNQTRIPRITFTMPDSDVTIALRIKSTGNITITATENGSVTADSETAENGDTVTLTVSPDEGYTFESCSVIDSNENTVGTSIEDNKITFTMPDSDVTVTVTFKKTEPEATEPDEPNPEETSSETETPTPEVTSSETESPTPEVTSSETEAPTPEVTSSETETPTPEVTSSDTEAPDPEVTSSDTEAPIPEVTSSDTEAPTPEVTSSDTEAPAPEVTSSDTETPVPDETTVATETPDPDNSDSSEDLTIDIDEENKITGNNVIQAGGEVSPGETVDITDENSDASAYVKLPENAESGLSFIITNKTEEIINSANKILAEAARIAAEKAKAIKSTIENILNNKNKGFAYELKFTDSQGNTVKVEGSFVKAALPIPENLLPENTETASFFVYHATANGLEKIDSIFNAANNTVEFAATSFSPYLITIEELTGDALASDENGSTEPEATAPANTHPGFVIPLFTVSSTEATGTDSVTAAPIPTASSTAAALTTVPPAASDAPAAPASPEANATPIDSADNMGKPNSENAADTTPNSSITSGMGFADTNAMTGLALELVPLLAVTAIGVLVSMKKK